MHTGCVSSSCYIKFVFIFIVEHTVKLELFAEQNSHGFQIFIFSSFSRNWHTLSQEIFAHLGGLSNHYHSAIIVTVPFNVALNG